LKKGKKKMMRIEKSRRLLVLYNGKNEYILVNLYAIRVG